MKPQRKSTTPTRNSKMSMRVSAKKTATPKKKRNESLDLSNLDVSQITKK